MVKLKKLFSPTAFKIGVIATLLSLFIYGMGIPFFQTMELKAYDLHFYTRGKVSHGREVAIVTIDEKSVRSIGRWPWPRTVIADLVEKLDKYGVKVVAFDVIFSEPDESSGLSAIKALKNRLVAKGSDAVAEVKAVEKEADNDFRLASVFKDSPSAILGYFFFTSKEELKHSDPEGKKADFLISSRYTSVRYMGKGVPLPDIMNAEGVEENIKQLSEAGHDFGYFNVTPDFDGTVRWVPLAVKYNENVYPHLSIQAVRKYMGSPQLVLNVASYGVDSIQLGDKSIPTDETGRLLINYKGPQQTFPHYSAVDVLKGEIPADALKDKIILVGATAIGIYDMRVTPFSGTFPGVEVHANVIDSILRNEYIQRPQWVALFDVLAIIILGIFISLIIPRLAAVYSIISTSGLIALYIIFNNYIFNSWNLWLSEVYPVFSIAFVAACVTTYQFMTEERKKREIKAAFSHYVAPSLVHEVLKDPKKLILGGEERRLTVLFSDIRGFTTISESLQPQSLVKLMNDYLTPMTDIVLNNGGTVDKYMGDAIMAFWGAPIWQEDHAVKACRASIDMMKMLAVLQVEWEKAGIPKIDIGIGLSTGKVTVGNMGSTTRFDYTVMGDTVNLGSRLEGLNKEYGTHIIVPKYTYEDVKSEFVLRQLDLIKVKGKHTPIHIYELMGYISEKEKLSEMVERFETGLSFYMAKKWDMAEESFNHAMRLRPEDGPSKVFLERIKELRKTELPDDWDGAFVMTRK